MLWQNPEGAVHVRKPFSAAELKQFGGPKILHVKVKDWSPDIRSVWLLPKVAQSVKFREAITNPIPPPFPFAPSHTLSLHITPNSFTNICLYLSDFIHNLMKTRENGSLQNKPTETPSHGSPCYKDAHLQACLSWPHMKIQREKSPLYKVNK